MKNGKAHVSNTFWILMGLVLIALPNQYLILLLSLNNNQLLLK